MKQTYYRCQWTSGRYNAEANTALMYNLLEGRSFFFESYSAQVIDCVLSVQRNEEINVHHICEQTAIAIESITDFMETLIDVGLVSNKAYSEDDIRDIRLRCGKQLKSNPYNESESQLSYDLTNAEEAYAESLDKDKYIPTVMFEVTYNCSER